MGGGVRRRHFGFGDGGDDEMEERGRSWPWPGLTKLQVQPSHTM